MAANVSGEYRIFKYYEGLCSSSDFPKEIAKVLSLGVKSQAIKDIDGNVIEEPFVLRNKNWDIVYPAPDASLNLDLNNLTTQEYYTKIMNQVSKISDTVILKTTTTPKEITSEELDDLTVDSDTNKASLTMYLEIYHPTYIADPEQYPLDCEREGIIPKLVTKEMYEKSYRATAAAEEYIYADSNVCTVDKRDDTTTGSIEVRYELCDSYVSKINAIVGNTLFNIPTSDGAATSCTLNYAYLTKIKQNDVDLYNLILSTLEGGEGIEPKDYSLLDSLTIEILREESVYTMMLEGVKKLTTYNIAKGSTYTVANLPIENLVPEYYLDGIYIPLDSSLFHTDSRKIIFDENINFEANTDGVIVIRYNYECGTDSTISERVSLLNNHYVLMRLFDHINDAQDGPMDNMYNANGDIIQTNSHVSPWSKLAWYQDFEEVMLDTIDTDIAINNLHDGTVFVPLETVGLNADTKIRYWINTNNDRFSMIVMGNPSMDYERDRHLVSACYCGRIDSFENSINDTAGNFALFTSSSTEPCNTTLKTEQMTHEMQNFYLTEQEVKTGTYNEAAFTKFVNNCPWSSPCGAGQTYYIQLTDKNFFNRKEWPRYVIVDANGKAVTPLVSAYKRVFIMSNGKSDLLELTIDPNHAGYDDSYTIYVSFSYYQEKFVITSGVSRDVFGNVVDVDKVKDYGLNTSDGITSISMFHTRSKAYYQKHHMLFATTEEYMSKVMYGKSSYTGEYYADRIKVTHGNDGPRGTLSDLLVIDSSSLYSLDELVINKDFEKDPNQYEETFVYFPITAPYSPLSDSPNSRYGLAIKKEEIEPVYADEEKILQIACNELDTVTASWWPVDSNIHPRDVTSNGCAVYWRVLPETAWTGSEDVPSDYVPVTLAVLNTSAYWGNIDEPLVPAEGVTIEQGSTKATTTLSYVKVSGFENNTDGEVIMYGISPEMITSLGSNAQIHVVMNDGCETGPEVFDYNINGVPYGGEIGETLPDGDIILTDAAPDKYLMLYSVKKHTEADGQEKFDITKFACLPLADSSEASKNWLLQYPCSVNVLTEGGKGGYYVDGRRVQYLNTVIEYNSKFEIAVVADNGYSFEKAVVVSGDTEEVIETIDELVGDKIVVNTVDKDIKLRVSFALTTNV